MTGYDDTDLVVEQQLQEHYQERYGQPPDVASFWTQLSPQLEDRTSSLSRRQRFFGSVRRSLSFQKEAALPEISSERTSNRKMGRVGVWAAVLLALVLVGSMMMVFSMIVQGKHGSTPVQGNIVKGATASDIYFTTTSGESMNGNLVTTIYRMDVQRHIVRWQRSVKGLDPHFALIVVGNKLYGGASDQATNRSSVFAMNIKDGSIFWRTDIVSPDPPMDLSVTDRTVYMSDAMGKIYSLNDESGKIKWIYDTAPIWPMNIQSLSINSISITNGVVYDTINNILIAVDGSKGTLLWSKQIDSKLVFTAPVAIADTVYLTSYAESRFIAKQQGFAYAYDAKSGRQKWTYHVNAPVGEPTVADGMVVFNTNTNTIYALDARNGNEIWHTLIKSYSAGVDAVVGGKVYYDYVDNPSPSATKRFLGVLDLATGKNLWSLHDEVDLGAMAVKDDTVYIGTAPHQLEALNANDGKVVWHLDIGKYTADLPLVWLVS